MGNNRRIGYREHTIMLKLQVHDSARVSNDDILDYVKYRLNINGHMVLGDVYYLTSDNVWTEFPVKKEGV